MSIAAIIKEANKDFGEDTIVRGADLARRKLEFVTTGCLAFDAALSGGWTKNHWHEVIGNESSGKTVIALQTIAANQRLFPKWEALWIAAEHLPMEWAQRCGVDLNRLYVADTRAMEDAYNIVVAAQDQRAVDCIVVDSIPALVPLLEADKDVGEVSPGRGAYVTGQFFRKSGKAMKRNLTGPDRDIVCLAINQWRERIGVMFGDPRTTPGGKGKNFEYWTRVDIRKDAWLKADKLAIGQTIQLHVRKNKSGPAERNAFVNFYFDDGGPVAPGSYDIGTDVFNTGTAHGCIFRQGAYYVVLGEKAAKSKDELLTKLRADEDMRNAVRAEVLGIEVPKPKRAPAKKVVRRAPK